ncbi:hypothetical protein L6R52_12985 [Myxococcota bacterium]|nr:hypothetical protein [Myxococcota bacterium]
MAVIINELEIVAEPQPDRSRDPTRPNGEPERGAQRPPEAEDILDVVRWAEARARRVRAH